MVQSFSSRLTTQNLKLFKGIALFTPSGDLVYCIDPHKRSRWHLDLCAVLQEMLELPEPPHFLVPCYSATVDRWLDPKTNQVRTFAEASPLVLQHQALLNTVFDMGDVAWSPMPLSEELYDLMVLSTYRQQFPQLWHDHDLIVRFERTEPATPPPDNQPATLTWSPFHQHQATQGYVLRLYVSGHNAATERILQELHQLLETSLQQPYTLKVVDIYKHPDQAEVDQVTATPALVKVWPKPVRRIAGELGDVKKILQMLAPVNADSLL